MSDMIFNMDNKNMEVRHRYPESWKITLIDIGSKTMMGRRLKRVARNLVIQRNSPLRPGESDTNHFFKITIALSQEIIRVRL